MLVLLLLLISRLINWSWLRLSHSKFFSSGNISTDLEKNKPGPHSNARWLNQFSRLLRIYAATTTNPPHCLIRMVHHRDETAVSNPNFVCFIVFQRISFDFCAQKYFQKLNIFEWQSIMLRWIKCNIIFCFIYHV